MQPILANYTASITELKKSPTQLIQDAGDEAVAILNHNVASAYLVPSALYEKMIDIIDDYQQAENEENSRNDTEYLLSNKKNAKKLMKSIENIEKNKYKLVHKSLEEEQK